VPQAAQPQDLRPAERLQQAAQGHQQEAALPHQRLAEPDSHADFVPELLQRLEAE